MDSKEMLKDAAKRNLKIKFNDRLKVEVVKATKHLKKGHVFSPHKVVAERYIKEGIAKAVK